MRILRFPALEREKGITLTREHILRLEKKGKFPKPVRVTGGRAVFWVEEEIDQYIKGLIAERNSKTA